MMQGLFNTNRSIPTRLPWAILRYLSAVLNSNHGSPLEFGMTIKTGETILGYSGRKLGSAKVSAKRAGISVQEFIEMREQGLWRCYRCKAWKPRGEFSKSKDRPSGNASICRPCMSVACRASMYGVAIPELAELLRGKCAICEREGVKMEVDHDHATGDFRGVLCSRCNGALGYFLDSAELLRKALAYLEARSGS